MRVSSTVTINNARIRQLTAAAIIALEQTGEAIHTDLVQSQTMPRDTGALQNESTSVDMTASNQGRVTIVSATPYARRLYYHPEYNFNQLANINAGGEWFKPYIPGGNKDNFPINTFKELYRRNGGV